MATAVQLDREGVPWGALALALGLALAQLWATARARGKEEPNYEELLGAGSISGEGSTRAPALAPLLPPPLRHAVTLPA